jgi:hypothetical protein
MDWFRSRGGRMRRSLSTDGARKERERVREEKKRKKK